MFMELQAAHLAFLKLIHGSCSDAFSQLALAEWGTLNLCSGQHKLESK